MVGVAVADNAPILILLDIVSEKKKKTKMEFSQKPIDSN